MALPWLESLAPVGTGGREIGHAAGPDVLLVRPQWRAFPTWFPKQEGTLVELPETLEPLSFARDYLNCFHGLTHNTAHTNGDTEGCGHGQGSASFLTGAQALKTQDAVRVDISADQLYGRHVGNQTRFATLELGCESARSGNAFGYSGTYKTHISWRTPTSPAPYEMNPKLVFDRLFTQGSTSLTQATVGDRDFYKKSMIDYVLDDANRVRGRVAKTDQRKLDQYLTGVREVERRIQNASSAADLIGDRYSATRGHPGRLRRASAVNVRLDGAGIPDRQHARFHVHGDQGSDGPQLSVARLYRRAPRAVTPCRTLQRKTASCARSTVTTFRSSGT